jgi:hypothetical protein
MKQDEIVARMSSDAAARQALRVALAEVLVVADNWRCLYADVTPGAEAEAVELLSQVLGLLSDRARGALEVDGADVDVLVEWALADMADELT